jgi:dihydrodipicolinate synthase/N-acetylneuraminate lyase
MIAGIGQESVRQTLAMAEVAARLRYDAVLVRTPHFYRAQFHRSSGPQLEMLTYYRCVADRSPLPVVLYSVPPFTQYELPLEVVAELAQHPNIIGIKDSSGRPERIAELAGATKFRKRTATVTAIFTAVTARMLEAEDNAATQDFVVAGDLAQAGKSVAVARPMATLKTRQKETGFAVLSGATHTLHESLQAGATGGVLAFAACAPQCCYEIYTAWREGDAALATEKQQRVHQASRYIGGQLGVPGIKYACDRNGFYGGHPRLPLLPLTANAKQEVDALMADIRY